MKTRHLFKLLVGVSVLLFVIAACTPTTETVEVTRVVTETGS
jgi:hypothetical protein